MLEFNGESDHVHILVTASPKVAPSAVVNNLKTFTARLIRKKFKDHLANFYWKPILVTVLLYYNLRRSTIACD